MSEKEKVKKPKSKVRKILEWVGTGIIGVIFAFICACNICKLATSGDHFGNGNAFGYSNYVVLTNSMEPVYPVDTVIITYLEKPEEILKEWDEIKDLNLEVTDKRCINLTFFDNYTDTVIFSDDVHTNRTNPTEAVMTHQLFHIRVDENIAEGQGRYKFFVHGINTEGYNSRENQFQVFTEKELLGVVKTNSAFLGTVSKFISSVFGLLILLLIPCLYLVITSVLDIYKAAKSDEEMVTEEPTSGTISNTASLSEEDYNRLKEEMIEEMLNEKKGKKK